MPAIKLDPDKEPELAVLLSDPATPDWLKTVIVFVVTLDPVDVAAAIEVLSVALAMRADRLAGRDILH